MAKKFLSDIELDAGLVDVNGNTGTSGQILSSTGTAVDWIDQSTINAGNAEHVVIYAKNTSGASISKGTPVYITGTVGATDTVEIAPADAGNSAKMPAVGLLDDTLANNAFGYVITGGFMDNITTDPIDGSTPSSNDTVYVKAGGGLTLTKPTGSNLIQNVAKVGKVSGGNSGSLIVSSILRTNDVPNLTTGKIWVGTATNTDESGVVHLDETNGRMGIGTNSPTSDLHINRSTTSPVLRLSYEPVGGYGGGGSIRFQGGSADYVYGDIGWYNGSNKDADINYSAASRAMNFKVNDRSVSTNGYFRFFNDNAEVAEINAAGVYGNVFYDQGNTAYYVNPASTGNAFNALGYAHIRGGITTDGNARSYTWRALDNTGNSGTRYQKIARITSSQSSRFVIELAGRSTSYSTPVLPAIGYIVGQLNNDNDYDLVFYNHSGEDTVVDEVGQVDVSTTATDIYIKVSSFSEVTAHAHISDGTIAVESTSAGGTEPTNYVAATNIEVWNSRNDGSGSGLDADLLDAQQGSYYLDYNNFTNTPTIPSAYTHPTHPGDDINLDTGALTGATVISDLDFNITTDTLGHVTDANATYSTRNLTASDVGAAASSHTHTWANISGETANSVNGWGGLRHQTNDGYIDFGPANTGHAHIYTDRASFYLNAPLLVAGGSIINSGDIRANLFYDKNNTSYYVNPGGNSEMSTMSLDSWLYHRGDTDTFMGFAAADTIRFVTNSAERMEIGNGGVVFGGGATAAKPVHIATADQGTARLRIENTNASGDTFDLIAGVHNVTQEGFSIYQENASATRLRIDDDGNVGIGTNYPGQKLQVNGNVSADIYYDRNNTGYFFNGDASKDNVDLTSSGNYAINVLGTISGGHRKHGNLETPEMQWSVGGGTDLNWKKLVDIVVGDANYSGWGAEIEITNFSGNYGNATYSGGELFKGALSIYHWGGTGTTPEYPYANIPYEMRSYVRWYKTDDPENNRSEYQLQVKSPGNFQQLYIKVKPGIGNQIVDIIPYANDTNGATSGGTAYSSIQNANFNHEFVGGIWTNDSRSIGWKNGYGSPFLSTYYGSITTSTSVYIGGPTGNGQDLYCDDLRSNKVFDRAATAYYFEGGNTGDSIRVAGDVVAYYSSDKRLKDNIKPIENALDKVNAISGVTFEWNEKSHKTTGRKDVGVVAQEVEEVFPEIVETRTNGFKAVDYQKLTAVLIESVKELTAKVKALESKQCNCK